MSYVGISLGICSIKEEIFNLAAGISKVLRSRYVKLNAKSDTSVLPMASDIALDNKL
jgi:hypothetical protein